MVNLITEKMTYPVGKNNVAKPNIDLAREHKLHPILSEEVENKDVKSIKLKKSQLVSSISMIGAGGVLLYLGLRTPSKLKLFKKGVESRLFQMESLVNSYCAKVDNMVAKAFGESKKCIQEFAEKKCIKPSEYLVHFQKIKKPDEIIIAKDLAMSAISSVQKGEYNGGPSDFDFVAVVINREKNELDGRIFREGGRVKMELCNYVHIPKFADGKYANKVAEAEADVSTRHTILDRHIINTREQKVDKATQEQFKAIAEVVLKSREMALESKKQVIDVAFKKMSKALNLDNFAPSYNTKNYSNAMFSSLTPKELKAQLNIPNKFKNAHKDNVFLDILENQDFNKLSEDDISMAFHSLSDECNLNDLRFMIDGLRLEYEVAKSQSLSKSKVYKVMIAKLQCLANELQTFGEKELFDKSAKNFDKLKPEQRPSIVFSIVSVAKKLGYNSLGELEDYFATINKMNSEFNIDKYLKLFLQDPEKYFV